MYISSLWRLLLNFSRSCIALCSSHSASAVFAAVIHLASSSYSAAARYPSLCLNEVRSK